MSEKTFESGFVFSLSTGVLKRVQFERHDDGLAWGVGADGRATWLAGQFKIGKDLFVSVEDAVAAANEARAKKLDSLHKQISKLEKMVFKVVD